QWRARIVALVGRIRDHDDRARIEPAARVSDDRFVRLEARSNGVDESRAYFGAFVGIRQTPSLPGRLPMTFSPNPASFEHQAVPGRQVGDVAEVRAARPTHGP